MQEFPFPFQASCVAEPAHHTSASHEIAVLGREAKEIESRELFPGKVGAPPHRPAAVRPCRPIWPYTRLKSFRRAPWSASKVSHPHL